MSIRLLSASEAQATTWLAPGIVMSALALGFTIASFWWIHVRRGSLMSYPPRSYAGVFQAREVRLVLPLVLHNTGAAPIVVVDLRLRLVNAPGRSEQSGDSPSLPLLMSWHALQPGLEPAPVGGGRVMPSPFPAAGRQAVERFVEFSRELTTALPLDAGPYEAIVEVQLAHRSRWRPLVSFLLHTELVKSQDSAGLFISRSNDPSWLP